MKKSEYVSIKFKPILGNLPEGGATDWWTDEQWDEHYKYVEKLKRDGRYETEGEEITLTMKRYPAFETTDKDTSKFSNFGIIMPK